MCQTYGIQIQLSLVVSTKSPHSCLLLQNKWSFGLFFSDSSVILTLVPQIMWHCFLPSAHIVLSSPFHLSWTVISDSVGTKRVVGACAPIKPAPAHTLINLPFINLRTNIFHASPWPRFLPCPFWLHSFVCTLQENRDWDARKSNRYKRQIHHWRRRVRSIA